ncbi:MAG TPA: fasciclin domain-containing protein [Candidatus Bathyarchaeia archaeon]|nr:fasciclin domain-containing protein [Candidatus Bathyarchaeia archaeon]
MHSKKLCSAIATALVILSIVGVSSVAFAQTQPKTATAQATQTIAQTLANNTTFTQLVSLLKKANLTDVLNGPGNFTLFAPTNAAFAKVNSSTIANLENNTPELKNLLLYHVVPTKLLANNFTGSGTLTTVNGLSLPYSVNGTTIQLGNATVTKTDINATNGVIHVIDGVLMPPTNATATASPTASSGFLGLPGFEIIPAVAGLLVVAYLMMRRRT